MARKEGYRWRRGGWQPTERQREVLDLLLEGKSNAEIAVRLGITIDGAKWHVSELLAETGCVDRQALAAWWRRERGRGAGWALLPWFGLRRVVAASVVAGAGLVAVVFSVALLGGVRGGVPETATAGQPSPTPWAPTPSPEEAGFAPIPLAFDTAAAPSSCPVSQQWQLRPVDDRTSLLTFGTGDGRMAWLSWPPVTGWYGPGNLSPIAWTVTSAVTSDAILTGRRLDGDAVALFATRDSPEVLSAVAVLPAPHDLSHFVYVVTPSPGCWQFTLRADNSVSEITVYREGEPIPDSCPVSSSREVRPSIAPGIGEGPVWMISGQTQPWLGADVPMKAIWIIDDSVTGAVRLTGERIDGQGVALFGSNEDLDDYEHVKPSDDEATVAGINARNLERLQLARQTELILEPPHSLRTDHRGYVFYPSPGCWRFTAETDHRTFKIIQYVYDRPS